MLRNLGAMRTTVQINCGNHSQLSNTVTDDILKAVAREITSDFGWSTRRRETFLLQVAPYTTGTVAATSGGSTVTGTGTTWPVFTTPRRITIAGGNAVFRAVWIDATHLTLADAQETAVNWPFASVTGATYSLFRSEHDLPSDVDQVLGGTEQFPLTEVTPGWIEAVDPLRTSRGTPTNYALRRTQLDSTGTVEKTVIEFYPVPSVATTIRVPYLCHAPELSGGDSDLPACPSQLIELLATSRAADFLYSKTGDARWAALSDRYYRRVYGSGGTDLGLYERLKAEDEARYGMPRYLGGDGVTVGLDRLSERDWGEDLAGDI